MNGKVLVTISGSQITSATQRGVVTTNTASEIQDGEAFALMNSTQNLTYDEALQIVQSEMAEVSGQVAFWKACCVCIPRPTCQIA